jgi:hypothetical protein
MEHLIKEEILAPLDFTDFDHYANCIKGKYVRHIKIVELHVVLKTKFGRSKKNRNIRFPILEHSVLVGPERIKDMS